MQQLSVDQIKASVRIEDVVRRRGVALRANQSGERLEGHCPFTLLTRRPASISTSPLSAITALAAERTAM